MRVLLATPSFHGYWRSYASSLEELGHSVEVFLYDNVRAAGVMIFDKFVRRVPEPLAAPARPLALRQRVTRGAVAFVESANVDVALVIKGDILDHPFWDALERRGIPSVLYLYDELGGLQHTADSLRRPRHVATYSPRDCRKLQADGYSTSYVPLFFDPKLPFEPVDDDGVVFVGARFPHREALLVDLDRRGVPVTVYGREWSHRLVDRLYGRNPRRPPIATRSDVTLSESYGLAAGAAAAVNIHAEFDGVNHRTFEICGVGGLQLTDRADIADFYELGEEVLVYGSPEELEGLARRAIEDRAWSRRIRDAGRHRTLAEHTCRHRVEDLVAHW